MSLVKNEVRGCLGCNACRYGKPCIQNDSFNELVPKIKEADCIVFASPLYFWTFEHAAAYYRFIFINYIGFYDRGGCFLQAAAGIRMESRRLIKQTI